MGACPLTTRQVRKILFVGLAHSLDREPVPSPRREIEAEEVSHMLALLSVATKDVPGVLRSKQGRSIGVPWAKKLGSCAWNGFPFALTSRGSEICSVGVLYLALLEIGRASCRERV